MDELALQLLALCQNLVDTKLLLETFMKEGFITLAQSRYSMGGPSTVSCLQLPTEEWEPFEAQKRVILSECMRQEIGFRFNYLSLDVDQPKVKNLGSELIHRNSSKEKVKEPLTAKRDPLKWFGVLLPNSMRQSQKHFSKAVELAIESTNLQNEIRGVLGRRKIIHRQLKKMQKS